MDRISQIDTYSDTITPANRLQPRTAKFASRLATTGPVQEPLGPILELAHTTRGATMRSHWIAATLLSTALLAGCNGRNNDNSQNTGQNEVAAPANAPAATDQTVAPASPAETQQPSTSADNSAVRTDRSTTAARSTTGRRETSTRAAAPSRSEAAPQANSSYSSAPAAG